MNFDLSHLGAESTVTGSCHLLQTGGINILVDCGMCTGGRIIDHLKSGLDDSTTDILFTGYQAKGTPGREILKYADRKGGYVTLDGESYPIRAAVQSLSGYSAHADQRGLLEWATAIRPERVKLVHGEPGAQHAFQKLLQDSGISTVCPAGGQRMCFFS